GAVVDDGFVAAGVLGRDLALAERRMCELPVARAVADGVDVRDARAPVLVGRDPGAPVELHPGAVEADSLDERPAPDRDEHQVGLHGLAVAEMNGQLSSVVVDACALLAEVE